jgi:hypothetical protein
VASNVKTPSGAPGPRQGVCASQQPARLPNTLDHRPDRPSKRGVAAFKFNRRRYQWRWSGDGIWHLTSNGNMVARVIPDDTYRWMYRIDLGDRVLSDAVNLVRAKDAALSRADRAIGNCRQCAGKAPPIAFGEAAEAKEARERAGTARLARRRKLRPPPLAEIAHHSADVPEPRTSESADGSDGAGR